MLIAQRLCTKCIKPNNQVLLKFHRYRKKGVSMTRQLYSHLNLHIHSCNFAEAETAEKEKTVHDVVKVEPRPKRCAAAWFVDLIEKAFVWMMYDKSQPLYYLSGNFAPVEKETPPCFDLPVKGYLPECLTGEFFMVGPNPKFAPVAGYNWFDGDGMIHGMRIKDGKATYVSRYVRTSRLMQEEYFGGTKFIKIGDLKGFFGLFMVLAQSLRAKLKVLDMSYGNGTGNTALIYHQGKLLALSESDKPYEMFTFGYSFEPPYVTYRVINKEGVMLDPVPIAIPAPVMMHDFSITQNYAIFMDLPLYIQPKDMVQGKLIFRFDDTVKARFGILPRYAKNDHDIRWFELPNCFIFHNANAWEEDDEVVLITCRLQNPQLDLFNGATEEKLKNVTNQLYEMRFNMKTGEASQKQLSVSLVDFPRINENYTGRKQRYVYCTKLNRGGIIKFDLEAEPECTKNKLEVEGKVAGEFNLGLGRYESEAIFVPYHPGMTGEEDDGYLIFFVHDENTGKSEVNVIDAKTMSAAPVAVVELPARVPYGLHAFFLTEGQLESQVVGNT
ncbi:Carotenoid cleavage dioxygenase 1 [Rhynchospora pubera]|uniref:carotenoid 9,10-dioxygenase n=1 Tax=Rhynchospora pubera TaxID=906938 RepID=A0AAV8CMV7_9POAL|nr:Carotenoid cleavage dioxygenase 1 [Rhynchospora pubera]